MIDPLTAAAYHDQNDRYYVSDEMDEYTESLIDELTAEIEIDFDPDED